MGKNDKKKNDPSKVAAKKARIQAKQEKATSKRNKKELKEQGEDDIESILAEYQEKERKRTAVTITPCSQPTPRSNFSLVSLPNNEMLLFGGEYCDGESTVVYNDLFRWNVERNEWRLIESLNTPSPRCSHQAVIFRDCMYIFGGEYATLDQFHHYRDMWALDLKTNVWREVTCQGEAPSARSGHRMVVWRNFLVLFGGFYEALKEVRWFGDLYLFSFQDERWISIPAKPYAPCPKPRSGFLMTIHPADDAVFVFGGYSREKTVGSASAGSSKAASSKSEGKIHGDMWMLSLRGLLGGSGGGGGVGLQRLDPSKATWQKISNKGSPPSVRCGATMLTYKNKGIYFGGVFDHEGPRHTMQSMFFNDLYAFDFERKRWYALGLKVPKIGKVGDERKKKRKKNKAEASTTGTTTEINDDNDSDSESDDGESDDDEGETAEDLLEREHQTGNYFGYIDNDGNVVYINIDDMPDDDDDGEDGPAEHAFPEAVVTGEVLSGVQDVSTSDTSSAATVEATQLALAACHLNPDNDGDDEDGAIRASYHQQSDHEERRGREVWGEEKGAEWAEEEVGCENDGSRLELSAATHVETNPLHRYFPELPTCPVGRINAALAMRGASLVVYGGLTEVGDVEVTLDDCWSLDLNKRDKWRCLLAGSMRELVWKGDIDDDGSEMTGEWEEGDSEDDDDSDCEDSDRSDDGGRDRSSKKKTGSGKGSGKGADEGTEEGEEAVGKKAKKKKSRAHGEGGAVGVRAEAQSLRSSLPGNGEDDRMFPLYGQAASTSASSSAATVESLRDFYSRSSSYWKDIAVDQWTAGLVNMDGEVIAAAVSSADGDLNSTAMGAEQLLHQSSGGAGAGAGGLGSARLSEKEVKKIAFNICQRQYTSTLSVVTRLAELEQDMGVSNDEGSRHRSGKSGGSSKRR